MRNGEEFSPLSACFVRKAPGTREYPEESERITRCRLTTHAARGTYIHGEQTPGKEERRPASISFSSLYDFLTGYQTFFHDFPAVTAGAAIPGTGGSERPVFCRDPCIVKHLPAEKNSMSRFGQIKQISSEVSRTVGLHDQTGIAVGPCRQFDPGSDFLIMGQVLRADQSGIGKIVQLPVLLPEKSSAENRIRVSGAVLEIHFSHVRDQVVMKNLGGAVPEAAAVCQQTHGFAVFRSPVRKKLKLVRRIIQVPLEAEAVEKFPGILQCIQSPQFHID